MSRLAKRRNVNHTDVAATLRANPQKWHEIGEYRATTSADDTARRIRLAERAPMYEPAGSFEARVALTEFGAIVAARYVGPQPAPRPGDSAPPMRDCERIRGQIERGEVLAGPEGARRIAAKHEEAYGAVFARRTADEAWADAVAGLYGADDLEDLRTRLPLLDPDRHALDTAADNAFAQLACEHPEVCVARGGFKNDTTVGATS